MSEEIPGIVPTNNPAPEVIKTLLAMSTLRHKGKVYSYTLEKGKPLKIEWHGQVPKKVLRRLEKQWRKLNPPQDRTLMPLLQTNLRNRFMPIQLNTWLREKAGVA